MITTIRSQFKQTTYRYIVFFMVCVIAFSMISSLFIKSDRIMPSWALKVNGVEISNADFNKEVAKQVEFIQRIRAQYGDMLIQALGWQIDPKVRALDNVIKEELLYQYGKKLGLVVSPDYMQAVINDAVFVRNHLSHIIPSFVFDQSGMLDMHAIRTFLKQNNISAQQFEQSIERALLQIQVIELIVNASYTPLFDVRQSFIGHTLAKQYSYLVFSLDKYIQEVKKSSVSDEDLRAFFDSQNTQLRRYWVPEKRTATVWKFSPKTYNTTVSNDEIARYYEDNKVKQYVLDPLKVEIEKIVLRDIDINQSLDEIRQDLISNSASSWSKYWKIVKPFARGEHKGELEKNAFVLQNEGEISPVFETSEGPMIIKLVRRIPRTYKPLATVHNEIKTFLAHKSFKKDFVKDIKALLQSDDANLAAFIIEKAAKKELIPGVIKDESRLSQELFGLKKGQYSFYIEQEEGMLVLLSDITERYLPDLNSIKQVVKDDYYEHVAKEMLAQHVHDAQEALKTQSLAQVAEQFTTPLHTTSFILPTDHKALSDLEKKGLSIREIVPLEKLGSSVTTQNERDTIIVRVENQEKFDEQKFLSEQKNIRSQLESMQKRLFIDSFVASLHRNATIETNESLITSNKDYSE